MPAAVILVEASPRSAGDGLPIVTRLAGGGAAVPYRYGDHGWRAGIIGLPTTVSSLDFDGEQLGGGGVSQALELRWGPATAAALAELAQLYWADAPITVRIGPEGAAMPPIAAQGLVLDTAIDNGQLRIALADPTTDLKRPLLIDRFAGTGGVEGPVEWTGKIKTRAWGRCFNVPGLVIDQATKIVSFGDPRRRWLAFDQVRDRGVPAAAGDLTMLGWQGSAETTFAALQAASATVGGGVLCPSIACVKWWTLPAGDLHADIRGEVAGGYVETAPEIAARIVAGRSSLVVDAAELTAAIAARQAPFGWLVDSDSSTAAAELTEMLAGVSLSWLIVDGAVAFRRWEWTAATRTARSEGMTRTKVYKPIASRTIGYRRNWAPMARGDLAAFVLVTDILYDDGTTAADAIANAGTTANYSGITDDSGQMPEPNATNSANPGSAFGSTTVGAARSEIAAAQSALATAQSDIAGLLNVYGNTTTSAAAAAAAAASRDAALLAQQAAEVARGQAQGAYAAADSARSSAVDAKNLAASSSSAAAGSASAAAGSANQASSSASDAGNSATSASGYANTAAIQASNAAGAASGAATSASGAIASQTAAATSASAASTAKLDAQAARDAAAGSASASAGSASSAAGSAMAAGNSASAARTSEINAGSSYQGAAGSAANAAASAGSASSSAGSAATSASTAAGSANDAGSYAVNAANSASAAGGSASAASTQASNAQTSANSAVIAASSAQAYANTASTQAGNAQFYANSAGSSSAAATAAAAAAQQSATLSASVGGGLLNPNAVFADWANPAGTPTGWYFPAGASRVAGNVSPYAVSLGNSQACYEVSNVRIIDGAPLILEAALRPSGPSDGVYVCLQWFTDDQSTVQGGWYYALSNTPAENQVAAASYNGDVRRYNIYVDARVAGARYFRAYVDTHQNSTCVIDRLGFRLASASEIAAQKAAADATNALAQITYQAQVAASATAAVASQATTIQSQLNGLSATVSQQAGTISSIDGKTQAYFNISAQAGGNMAYVSVFANNGQGGLTSGVILGGNTYVDGNLVVAGSVQTGAAAVNAFGAISFSVNTNTFYGQGTGGGQHLVIDPDTGEKTYVYNNAPQQLLCSVHVDTPYKADIVVSFTAAQGFSQGNRNWFFTLNENGGALLGRGGLAANDTPNGRGVRPGKPAGSYTYDLYWVGQDGNVNTSDINLLVEVSYNYGNATA